MSARECIAWLLTLTLAGTAATLWWRGRDRYEFRSAVDGRALWRVDRSSGKAWLSPGESWRLIEETKSALPTQNEMSESDVMRMAGGGWSGILAKIRAQFPVYTNRTDDEMIAALARRFPALMSENPSLRAPLEEVLARTRTAKPGSLDLETPAK